MVLGCIHGSGLWAQQLNMQSSKTAGLVASRPKANEFLVSAWFHTQLAILPSVVKEQKTVCPYVAHGTIEMVVSWVRPCPMGYLNIQLLPKTARRLDD